MRQLVAILNPQADRGRTALLADSLRSALGSRFPLRLKQTTRRGEAISLAEQAGSEGADAVIAIGGDGTVHEVMNGLMQTDAASRPALGILPAGSGNDVAFALGIDHDLPRAAAMIERFETRAVDIGEVRALNGAKRFCINNVGLLLEGEINCASHGFRWPRGPGLYIRAMLQAMMRPLPSAELQLQVDGVRIERRAMIFSVANGPRSGGKFQLMPDATLDDGRFDYVLASPIGRIKLLWNVRHALAGKLLTGPWIERGRFTELSLRADRPLVAHVDGEPWFAAEAGIRQIEVSVLPSALRVLTPPKT